MWQWSACTYWNRLKMVSPVIHQKGFFEAVCVVDTKCVRDEWAYYAWDENENEIHRYLVPAACFAFRPEQGREMGGWTGGTKEKCSYGKHIRQRNLIPSYWVLQAQDTHAASTPNSLGEYSQRKQTKKLKHRREFHSAICGFILQIFNGLVRPFG